MEELRNMPSPRDDLAPQFVNAKAANMMFSHHVQRPSVRSGVPRSPLKGLFYQPERRREEKDMSGITVQRDWDVERADSVETDLRPLTEVRYQEGW